jgi:hypothetical protein
MRDGEALMHTPGFTLLRRPSRRLGALPVRVFVALSWQFPCVSAWPIFVFSAPFIVGRLLVGAVIPEVSQFSAAPAP